MLHSWVTCCDMEDDYVKKINTFITRLVIIDVRRQMIKKALFYLTNLH